MKRLNLFIAFSLALSAVVFLACSKEDTTLTTTSVKSENVKATDRSTNTCCSFTFSSLNKSSWVTATLKTKNCITATGISTTNLTSANLGQTFSCNPNADVTLTIANPVFKPGNATIGFTGGNTNLNATATATVSGISASTQVFTFSPCFNTNIVLTNQ